MEMRNMRDLRSVAEDTAHYLGAELHLDTKETAAIRFGLESLLDFIINLGAIIGVAWWMGITSYVLAVLVPSSLLRLVSGGAHCSTFLRCLVLSLAIMIGFGQLAAKIMISQSLLYALIVFLAASGVYTIHNWVPADTPAKPIVSTRKRAMYRKISYIYMAIWTVAMSGLTSWGESVSGVAFASIGGVGWQIFSITPAGYHFVAIMEKLVDKTIVLFKQ